MTKDMVVPTIRFVAGAIEIIDQTLLPSQYRIISIKTIDELGDVIFRLAIRGAPALGLAGAYGLLLAVEEKWAGEGMHFFDEGGVDLSSFPRDVTLPEVREVVSRAADSIAGTRPTAVNLVWAIERLKRVAARQWASTEALLTALYREARLIHQEDLEMCRRLGRHGAVLLKDGEAVLTHCNAGGLATSGYGTALGVIFAAVEAGKRIQVFADETRPLLQGARLTAWECLQRGIAVTVVCEGAAGYVLSKGLVSAVIVGADRIAANGDTANKIGTLNLAVIASRYGVPFYVAAPSSTIDPAIVTGERIPIEMRPGSELRQCLGIDSTPPGAGAFNPAFDVTPNELISAIITEKGVFYRPFDDLIG
jgi:methylthioribose-1-phosphate isomerase